ncbi:MAG: VCBS repeat-containing protein [Planctomycetota bacterium]
MFRPARFIALVAAIACLACPGSLQAAPVPLETGSVKVDASTQTITLKASYKDPIVVCSLHYVNNTRPAVVRVDNVKKDSFEVWLQNPGDKYKPVSDTVFYMVLEAGKYDVDGVKFEAQTYKSKRTDSNSSWVGDEQSYLQSYSEPVVVGQVMSAKDKDWSVFWSRGSSQTNPPDKKYFYTGKHVAEDYDTSRADETIGFIVFETGHGAINGIPFDARDSADSIRGVGDKPPYTASFKSSFAAAPLIVITSSVGMDGPNGGWPVVYGDPPSTTGDARVAIDEDQINDSDRNHTTEQVAVIAFADVPALFTDVSASAGFGVRSTTDDHSGSGLHWGDLDNDGDLDAIVTGNNDARLCINNNAGQSFIVGSGGDRSRQGALLDIDNDGDLDFWYCDERLYENNGSASFTDRGNLGFSNPSNNEGVAAADVDHDGRCDIVMFSENGNWIGFNSSGVPAVLTGTNDKAYGLNDSGDHGNGDFCSSGDVNNDGFLDFFYNYSDGKIFLSDGNGTFTEGDGGCISIVTGNNDKMGTAWGDYDNDGDLDLWVSRQDSGYTGYLWKNLLAEKGSVAFTDVTASAGLTDKSGQRGCCWGDYDNDGDLDLYIATRSGKANVLYQNQGSPKWFFAAVDEGVYAPGDAHDAVFVDYDNDGDLDLAVTQEDANNTLLQNGTNNKDYLKVRVIGGGACGTNRAGVGVRVELWDAAGTTFLAMREVGVARGYGGAEPMWVHFGGVKNAATYTIKVRFVGGWSSQTVIPAAVSSTIGVTVIPQMLTVEEEAAQVVFTDVSGETGFDVQTSNDAGWGSGLHWGDLDGDGDLDAIVTGNSSSKLMIYDSAGSAYKESTFAGGSIYRQGALLDADNDGDLDFWGMPSYQNEKLLLNNGKASFTDAGSAGFSDPYNNEGIAAADVNGDGWCDVLNFSENGNWIGHNQGEGAETQVEKLSKKQVSVASPFGVSASKFARFVGTSDKAYGLNDSGDYGNGDYCSSGDVNNDGYLDFFYHYNGGKLFLSDGDGTYTQTNYGISVTTGGSDKMGSAWGDYDNDGDLDLFVARYDSGSTGYLWRNDVNWTTGSGSFTNVTTSAGITDTSGQQGCCWGDYDNDGDLDLYIVTRAGAANVLYRNQNDGTFVTGCAGADAPGDGHDAVFVDYDNDGDLDLAVTQEDAGNTFLRNNTDDSNYLKVRVVGLGAGGTNVAAVGIRVELWDSAGTTFIARREIGVARGFGGSEPIWLHFGGLADTATYTVKVYFTGRSVDDPYSETVVPASATTTIGGATIPQMLTIEEPQGVEIIQWREVPNRPTG